MVDYMLSRNMSVENEMFEGSLILGSTLFAKLVKKSN